MTTEQQRQRRREQLRRAHERGELKPDAIKRLRGRDGRRISAENRNLSEGWSL